MADQSLGRAVLDLDANDQKLQAKIGGVKSSVLGSFGAIGSKAQGLANSMLGGLGLPAIAIGGLGAAAAIGFAATAIVKATTETVAWAKENRDLSRNLGISTEETSRLIEVADDWGITSGQVSTALEMAVKRGYRPTIENLAILADKLQGMSDPLERAKLLTEMFGKNWSVLTPILYQGGDALRAQAHAVADGLILTDAASKKTREYEVAVDALKDSITALKHQVGLTVIDIWLKIRTALTSDTTSAQAAADAQQRSLREANIRAAEGRGVQTGMVAGGTSATVIAQRTAAATQAAIDRERAIRQETTWGLAVGTSAREARRLAIATDSLAIAKREVTRTQDRMSEGQQAWNGFAQDAAGRLENMVGHGKRYEAGLQAIDKATGSNLYGAFQLDKQQRKLEVDFARGKISAEQYGKGIADIGKAKGLTPMDTVIETANAAIARVGEVQASLNAMRDKIVTIWVRTLPLPPGTTGGGCFVAGTPVDCPGGRRRVEQVRVGQRVVVYIPLTGARITSRVVKTTRVARDDLVSLYTSQAEILGISPNHRFLTTSGEFVEVGRLAVGTRLVTKYGPASVLRVVRFPGEHEVYNLEVAHPAHTYLVAGHVVHNAKSGGQFGLDMIVPPGYNENFPVMAGSGERVTVETPGMQSSPHAGGGPVIGTVNVGNEIDEHDLLAKVARLSGRH